MKKLIVLSTVLALSVSSFALESDVHSRCIVQLKDNLPGKDVIGIAKAMSVRASASLKHIYTNSIKGFTINIPCVSAQTMFGGNENIKSMEEDSIISIVKRTSNPGDGTTTPVVDVEQISYGTIRVGGPVDGSGKTAWIIDTGVDTKHPDLNVDTNRGFTVFRNMDDENGHGTHVAGIIGAIDNTIGTVGVAQGSTIVPVRVLDRRGSGSISGVIAGIDHVSANAKVGDCVNLSLGGDISQALDDAVINAAKNSGAYFVLAAGNENDDANNHSPSRANGENVYTISAMDKNDSFAWFSNYGNPPVDFAAPGVDIISLWKGGGTNTISGTSMAAPHACAALMMSKGIISTSGTVIGDPDTISDSIITITK